MLTNTQTPRLGLQLGDVVRLRDGNRNIGIVVEIMNQEVYPGGVRLDEPFYSIFVHWNEDELELVRRGKG